MAWVAPGWLFPLLLCFTLLYTTQTLATDSEYLQQAIEQKITEMTGNDSDVQVQVSDGIVTLTGFLQDASLVTKIEAVVKATAGVTNVVSDLSVE